MKYEAVLKEDNTMYFGVSLGTVYDITYNNQIKLYNVGFLPRIKEFYYNQNIQLPKKLIDYFNERQISDKLIREMKELQILSKKEYNDAIKIYNGLEVVKSLTK